MSNHDAGGGYVQVLFLQDPAPEGFTEKLAALLVDCMAKGYAATVFTTGVGPLVRLGPIVHWAHVSVYMPPERARKPVAATKGVSGGASREGEWFAA